MKGRNGMELRGTKIALAAVLACLLSLTAWLGVSQMVARAAGEATASAEATYYEEDDSIKVTLGGEEFKFFTVANAKKKVPAANQWVRTDGGKVQLSAKAGAAIYYFANSTTPEEKDIVAVVVPSVPTISKVTYSPTETTAFKVKAKTTYFKADSWSSKNTVVDEVALSNVQYSIGNTGRWLGLDSLIGEELTNLQKNGAVINVRVKGNYEENSVVNTKDGSKSNIITKYLVFGATAEKTLSVVRTGAAKQVKIAKAAAGPSLTVDYANHLVKLKKNQAGYKMNNSYSEDVSGEASLSTEFKYGTNTGEVEALYDVTPGEEDHYIVQTKKDGKAPSNYTHITIDADKPLASYNATALISAVGEDVVLQVKRNVSDEQKKVKETLQYAVSTTEFVKGTENNKYFDYAESVKKGTTKLNWKNLVIKSENDSATVTIKKSALGSAAVNIYVRRAAVTSGDKELSSRVAVFRRDSSGDWTITNDYNEDPKKVANVTIAYAGDKTFSIEASNGTIQEKDVVFNNNSSIVFKPVASADASANATLKTSSASSINANAKLSVKLAIPQGLVKSSDGIENAAFTWSGKINTFVPVWNKTTVSKSDATFEFKSTLGTAVDKATVVYKKTASGNATSSETVSDGTGVTVEGKKIKIAGTSGEKIELVSFVFKNDNGSMTVTVNKLSDALKSE